VSPPPVAPATEPPSPPGPVIRFLASAGFRFALLFAVLFTMAGLAFSGVLWWGTAGALDRQADATIRADATALIERHQVGGRAALILAINERVATDVEAVALYLLTDTEGRVLAGNLDAWPEDVDPNAVWLRWPLLREGERSEARLLRLDLAGGDRLLVGRDVAEKLRLRGLLTEGLAWSAGVSGVFMLLGAVVLRRAMQARLLPVYETAEAIAGGDLLRRVPPSGREDEFERLATTMNAMLDRIAHLMQGVRGVSDAIAHDLRTPIARARAKLEDAAAHAEGEEALRAALDQGIADLDHITRVFQAVLRIAEVEAGARRAAFAAFDAAPVLHDAAELYGAMAEAREQHLEASLPETLPMMGDRDLVLQAVANLLDNAIKFTPAGGTVRLGAEASEGFVRIRVADEGPGLPPADRARVGERFFRADSARSTPGSGLGLSLVRAVAQLHGGGLDLADARPGAPRPGLAATLRLRWS
jgi:signal transduction histidine kinase